MQKNNIIPVVTNLVAPVVEELGLILWDVEFIKEAGEWFLRIYIDKPDGVAIEDCEAVSRRVDKLLDEHDPIDQGYILEVCSAGIERTLKRDSDFQAFMGSRVLVKLYKSSQGAKEHVGTLAGYENGAVTIDVNGAQLTFEKKDTALVRLSI